MRADERFPTPASLLRSPRRTPAVSFILKWLGVGQPPPRVGLRPHRIVELSDGFDASHERIMDALLRVLGANVYLDDRNARTIEAGFGLVNNERIRCTLDPLGDARTQVRIEAFFAAGMRVPEQSRAVDALATEP